MSSISWSDLASLDVWTRAADHFMHDGDQPPAPSFTVGNILGEVSEEPLAVLKDATWGLTHRQPLPADHAQSHLAHTTAAIRRAIEHGVQEHRDVEKQLPVNQSIADESGCPQNTSCEKNDPPPAMNLGFTLFCATGVLALRHSMKSPESKKFLPLLTTAVAVNCLLGAFAPSASKLRGD